MPLISEIHARKDNAAYIQAFTVILFQILRSFYSMEFLMLDFCLIQGEEADDISESLSKVSILRRKNDENFEREINNEKTKIEAVNQTLNKKRRELLEELKKVNNETKTTTNELSELEEQVAQAKLTQIKISNLFADFKRAEKVDICFMMDATSSMGPFINQTKSLVKALAKKISTKFQTFSARFAFVGYRDHSDGPDRISRLSFTDNLNSFDSFVEGVAAIGGADQCEDVLGGLDVVLKLPWLQMTRYLFHIGDAPCHGRRFYNKAEDSYPRGDIRGLKIADLMKKLSSLNIQYYFTEINSSTRKMIKEFDKELQSAKGHPIKTLNLPSADDLLKILSNAVIDSIMRSKSLSLNHSVGKSKKTLIINKSQINWSGFGMVKHQVEFYDSCFDGQICDAQKSVINHKKIETNILIDTRPFANGALRFATAAILEINGSQRQVVLKESLFADDVYNTEKHIKTSIEGQIMACFLAKEFTKISPSQKRIRIVDIGYLRDIETGIFYSVEEYFPGKFIKWSSNAGFINEDEYSATLDCFAHWSYHATNQFLVVTDIQGCKYMHDYLLTDPAITCPDQMERFGTTNLGKKGLTKFFESHRCNHICRHLNLIKHKAQILPDRDYNPMMTAIRK